MEPTIIKLAETRLHVEGMEQLLRLSGASEAAIHRFEEKHNRTSTDGELLIELAGRVCYQSWEPGLNPNVTRVREHSKDYFKNILEKGDGSVCEHATVTFALVGVSRILTHELVRHRAGTAFSQESGRYVRIEEIKIPKIESSVDPKTVSSGVETKMLEALKTLESDYRSVVDKIDWDSLSFDQKKSITSAIRRILPQGLSTIIIFTANHRTLRWLIEMRTSPGAEYEIRKIFGQIAEICMRDYPLIYSDFEKTQLTDGTSEYKPTLRSKV